MQQTAVINVVGLTSGLIAKGCPALTAFMNVGKSAAIRPVMPAVTCPVQATYLTGRLPHSHGIIGNGWYDRETSEVHFWRQSNHLVQGPKIWDLAKQRDPTFTCANSFWWFNMYSSVDYSITPRPMYPADGRKIPDIYTVPDDLRRDLQDALGPFPLFRFWGPGSDIASSEWIAQAAKRLHTRVQPTLHFIYLPHLDYGLQKFGPDHPGIGKELRRIDAICGDLIAYFRARTTSIVLLSEYGIAPVSQPVHLNRILREHGLLRVREELRREILDPGASAAFAVADHQMAHIYIRDAANIPMVRTILGAVPGIAAVLGEVEKKEAGLDHPRSGDLIAVATASAWFTYYYWMDDERAPDFARTVDIHRKPGYDPVELFIDPTQQCPPVRIGYKLFKQRLGFRTLLDVIPLDATLVKGSHGRLPADTSSGPLLISDRADLINSSTIPAEDVCDLIMSHVFETRR